MRVPNRKCRHVARHGAVPGYRVQTSRVPRCALLGNPAIAFLATDKVIGNLLGSFSTGDSNPIPPSLFVINEDMRTGTLNSRLSFESHSITTRRVPNLFTHPYFSAALTAFSQLEGRTGCTPPPARTSTDCLIRDFRSRGQKGRGAVASFAVPRPIGAWLIDCSR